MDFVLALHSHLPWVLHHGRWPHGSDWLCEAAVDTYLPLLAVLEALERQGQPGPMTIGITPILANQLAHPDFITELEAFLTQRVTACDEATAAFAGTAEAPLVPIADFWRARLARLHRLFRRIDHDVVGALRHHAAGGRVELMSSAATHGFLPLLARDESIRFQLLVGRREHRRLFGADPRGCWVPECAYRQPGPWAPLPDGPRRAWRAGTASHLRTAGFDYFFADAHMAEAGRSLGLYGERDFVDGMREPDESPLDQVYPRSPYQAYHVTSTGGAPVTALVRDPQASLRVWSRHQGFPGDGGYLEFHKIRWPGGLKLWRVTGTAVDLGGKEPYDPNVARARAHRHAGDLAAMLIRLAGATRPAGGRVVVSPFDTELFGHWWFEGVDFLGDLYRALARQDAIHPVTAGGHLDRTPTRPAIELADGSWGANGDYSKWLNPETEWTWIRLWGLEERFWTAARRSALAAPEAARPVWEQAGRELLLAQASDWQFIISTGAAGDYAERRFREHCDGLADLVTELEDGSSAALDRAARRAAGLRRLDDPFPDLWSSLVTVLES